METVTESNPDVARVLVMGDEHLAVVVAEELALRGALLVRPGDPVDPTSLTAAILCDDDDVSNIAQAIELRDRAPQLRIVLRSFNTAIASRLPDLLGDCVAMSATRLAAAPLCDLAVGTETVGQVVRRRRRDPLAAIRASQGAAVGRQRRRRQLFRWLLLAMAALVAAEAGLAIAVRGDDGIEALHAGLVAALGIGAFDLGLSGPSLAGEAAWVQVAAVAAMVMDLLVVGVLFGLVTDALVGERIARVFGGSARRLDDHVIVAGLGNVGFRVVVELIERGHRVAALEADPDNSFIVAARRLGVIVEVADVQRPDVLSVLGVERARALIAVTDDDAANLEAALTAQALAPRVALVVRIFDSDIAARLERMPAITASRSVARLAAPSFVDAALAPA